MCEKERPPLKLTIPTAKGSRRRRLWELPAAAHCPLIGVCLSIPALRRLYELYDDPSTSYGEQNDYAMHSRAVNDCRSRMPVTERIQAALDRRYTLILREAAQHKTADALASWWSAGLTQDGVPGRLWAVLTHPRCNSALDERVITDTHMLQHQLGAAQRVDLQRHIELIERNAELAAELTSLQERSARDMAARTACIERQSDELMRLRAAVIGKDTMIASLQEELDTLERAMPDLRSRIAQAQQIDAQFARIHELERQCSHWQERARSLEERVSSLTAAAPSPSGVATAADTRPETDPFAVLRDKAVLCVGGRPGSVPVYREIVERTGGRFLYHDGGEENNAAQLQASLAAADLVICQTGCVSHGAYWRVKDHCKRLGKRCVYVDNPSVSSLERSLGLLPLLPLEDA